MYARCKLKRCGYYIAVELWLEVALVHAMF